MNEADILKKIDGLFPNQHPMLETARGDDCAVLMTGTKICVSSDIFLEDVHFRRAYFEPEEIGHKALAVNLSDIAAMGGKPVAFSLDLMLPRDLDETYLDRMLGGMAALARQNDLCLMGGDLSRADKLGFSISIWGAPGGGGRFLKRGGCRPGDVLFVCGDLGLARVGLESLEMDGSTVARDLYPAAAMAHLRPKPKILIGTLLCAASIRGLMDVSDGLARDLPRFLSANVESEMGAALSLTDNTLHPTLLQYAARTKADPLVLAMLGGEDYALLGAANPFDMGKVRTVPGVKVIGEVTAQPGITLNGTPFTTPGFDHFE